MLLIIHPFIMLVISMIRDFATLVIALRRVIPMVHTLLVSGPKVILPLLFTLGIVIPVAAYVYLQAFRPPQPDPCRDIRVNSVHQTAYQATDRRFFQRHPERHGKSIGKAESDAVKAEWWNDYAFVVGCRKK
jgi:hypothetical protein